MKQINLGEATAELPSLIDLASKGESFVITKGRVRLARLGPLGDPAPKKKFEFDTMKGWIWIADDFDAPLPTPYQDVVDEDERPSALALLLRDCEPDGIRLTLSASPARDERPSPSLASDFMRFLAADDRDGAARGGRHVWRWRRVH